MAYFIAPLSAYRHRVPVMRRELHPYSSPSWFEHALLNSILEESSSFRSDDPAFAFERPLQALKSFLSTDKREAKKEANVTEHHKKSEQEKDDFRLAVHIGKHNPNDLKVKVFDGVLTVSGRVCEGSEEDGMYSEYAFTRSYTLPKNVNVDGMTSKLTEDGLLVFHAPLLALEEPKEKAIPITMAETKKEGAPSEEIAEKGEGEMMESE